MLHNLVIEKYRLFQYLEVTSLANVNLIVGTNNSGKSSLLEATHLLTSDDARSSLIYLLNQRGEYISNIADPRLGISTQGGYQVSQIFHKRAQRPGQEIRISSDYRQSISLKIALHKLSTPLNILNSNADQLAQIRSKNGEVEVDEKVDHFVLEHAKSKAGTVQVAMPLNADGLVLAQFTRIGSWVKPLAGISKLITTNYLGYNELANLWDSITLTPKEDKVVEALQILEPEMSRLSFTSRQTSNSGILLRLRDQDEPIPLGSMGGGMHRILAIAAALVSVGEGTLLVDEIDTGLYYAVLKDMWHLILETAHKQNAQVFATTHSWDCVKAFQQALYEFDDPEAGRLIRLERLGEQIKAIPYSADELSIAVEQDIEVR